VNRIKDITSAAEEIAAAIGSNPRRLVSSTCSMLETTYVNVTECDSDPLVPVTVM